MKRRHGTTLLPLLLLALALAVPAAADDLTGAEEILCTAVQATHCEIDDECKTGAPWHWNVPQFIVVDLDEKMLKTTEASGENRVTPIKNLERAGGQILLQGAEAGRAFSFVITEATGRLSVAVAAQGQAVAVFGACTPVLGGN
jgi:hypothetical protein